MGGSRNGHWYSTWFEAAAQRGPNPKVIVWRTAVAAQGVWAEIDEPLVKEGFDYIRHYTAAELTTILDCEKGRVICTSFQGTRKIEVVADPGQGEWVRVLD
jgi:hypothetical protein